VAQFLLDHRDDEIVGYELASAHIAFGLASQWRPFHTVSPKNVTGRNLPQAKALVEYARLRTFARSRRSEKDDRTYPPDPDTSA